MVRYVVVIPLMLVCACMSTTRTGHVKRLPIELNIYGSQRERSTSEEGLYLHHGFSFIAYISSNSCHMHGEIGTKFESASTNESGQKASIDFELSDIQAERVLDATHTYIHAFKVTPYVAGIPSRISFSVYLRVGDNQIYSVSDSQEGGDNHKAYGKLIRQWNSVVPEQFQVPQDGRWDTHRLESLYRLKSPYSFQ